MSYVVAKTVIKYPKQKDPKIYLLVIYEHYNYIHQIDQDVVGFHTKRSDARKQYQKVVQELSKISQDGLQAIRYHVRLYRFPNGLVNDLHTPKVTPLDYLNEMDLRNQQYVIAEEWVEDPNFTYLS